LGCGMCQAPSKDYRESHVPSHLCELKSRKNTRVRTTANAPSATTFTKNE
jgi:hypothetical protein